MKLDLSMLVQELAVLPHTPVEHNEVSAYVLTHIFAPLREKHKVMFADLDFSAFTEASRIPKMICSRSIMIFWLRLQTTWTKNLMMTTK